MALIFLGVPYHCHHFKFRVSSSQIAVTSSSMMSGPSSPDLNPLDYQVWGQCWSLITSCNQSQKQFLSLKDAVQLIWSVLPEEASDNAVNDYRKQLKAHVSVNRGHFEHIM